MTALRIWADIDSYYEGYRWFGIVYFITAAVAFTGLIAFATTGSRGWLGKFLGNGLMVRTGRISYGLYVYHFFFPFIVPWMVSQGYVKLSYPWGYAWMSVFCSVVVAIVSWRFFEKPILGLKKYFNYTG